ncbi:hypothetical protein QFC19_008852 [Naganishia cerealis]|uniref:Uncharacterized protein n=1 Tax=Naganishia cerealis TaxID=610337 RepID=A0ACC2UYC5_9TREE|nr:hypothetical protein QFC19_008852 [Naganishia cerealis]
MYNSLVIQPLSAVSKKFPTEQAARAFISQAAATSITRSTKSDKPYKRVASNSRTAAAAKTTAVIGDEWARDYYAVKRGKRPGVYTSWHEAEQQVQGLNGAVYKRFSTRAEAEAYINAKEKRIKKKHQQRPLFGTSSLSKTCWNLAESVFLHNPNYRPLELPFHAQAAREQGFTVSPDDTLIVYTDGSARKNGKAWCKAGSGVFWGHRGRAETLNVAERVPGIQTNNRAELLGIIRALETCPFPDLPLEIRTDSQYSIACITQYLPIWLRNNFRLTTGESVKNQDMIVHILALLNQRGKDNSVKFVWVKAHRGEVGNEFADRLATAAAGMPAVPERTDWFTLDDVSRIAVARRRGQTTFVRTPKSQSTDEDEYEATDAKYEDIDNNGSENDDDGELQSSDGDEFGDSDSEFDKIIAEYEELYERNYCDRDVYGFNGEDIKDGDLPPDTCQEVEVVLDGGTHELVHVQVENRLPVTSPVVEVEIEIDPGWLLSQEEMADLEADLL